MQALEAQLKKWGSPAEKGKGKKRLVLSWVSGSPARTAAVMAITDCETFVHLYQRPAGKRLIYPVANANFPYQVANGLLRAGGQATS